MNDSPAGSEVEDAFELFVNGNAAPFSTFMSESPVAYGAILIGFLGLLVHEKFGSEPSRPDLAKYASDVHRAREPDGSPPLWVVESAIRAASGELSILDHSQSEDFFGAIGMLLRSLLVDLHLNDESKTKILLKGSEIVRKTLSIAPDESLSQNDESRS